MQPTIALITILTDDVPRLAAFYRDALGLAVKNDSGEYIEFATQGVRFSVCARTEMANITGDPGYSEPSRGHSFELAFPCATPAEVDATYATLVAKGARPITAPADMPWGQHTACFADPDGNIHEIFAEITANSPAETD
ncbi:MAG: hypothetical protein OJF49_002251 [Ktedonobacterales bacterium]|jgi:catechol 2,3-dioxygenase-like lactoylglutathione lyase family enzyme|nr:MAG: hypothetical protein OJF49_002251 [Ktedonobacterales bacterium]